MPPRESGRRKRERGGDLPAEQPPPGATDGSVDDAAHSEGLESPGKGPKRRAQDLADAAQPTPVDLQQSRQRRNVRRKAGGGTTSAQADAALFDADVQERPAKTGKSDKGQKAAAVADSDSVYEAVVKVFTVHCEPNFSLPWQRKRQYSSSSTGFIIQGRRILTNAHCVSDHTQVKVKRRGSDMKYVAAVLAVATEGDMALLTVEDPAFWEGAEPVTFGQLPQLQDAVTVVGYPIGGDTMSVTSGVVSRIEVTSYVHGAAELLGIQIDAAINSGNSGGPAFNEKGQCVGIAFQSLKHEDAENIGYIIPTPVVLHFITDYDKNGQYTGFPCLGIEWQKLENPDLRQALSMKAEQKGVMIRRIEPTSEASKVLKQNDVLLSFDGVPIANDGTVPFRSGERISFSYLVSQKYANEEATLVVLQGGATRTLQLKLKAPVKLIPYHIKGAPPSYFIVAGLVFTAVTVPYLRSEYGKEYDFDAPVRLLDKMVHVMADSVDQQVVVLSQVLASEVNIGYEDIINTQVISLNGRKVNNLKDLVVMVEHCGDEYLNFDLDYNQKVVLHAARSKQATRDILATHCIAQDRSVDLIDPSAGQQQQQQQEAAPAAAPAAAAAAAAAAGSGQVQEDETPVEAAPANGKPKRSRR